MIVMRFGIILTGSTLKSVFRTLAIAGHLDIFPEASEKITFSIDYCENN